MLLHATSIIWQLRKSDRDQTFGVHVNLASVTCKNVRLNFLEHQLRLQRLRATLSVVRLSLITTQTGYLNYVEVDVHGDEGFELLCAFRWPRHRRRQAWKQLAPSPQLHCDNSSQCQPGMSTRHQFKQVWILLQVKITSCCKCVIVA